MASAGVAGLISIHDWMEGEADMVGPVFIIAYLTVVYGMPVSLVLGVLRVPQVHIKYDTNESRTEYEKILPHFEEISFSPTEPDSLTVIVPEKNEQAVWGLPSVIIDKSPESSRLLSWTTGLSAGFQYSGISFSEDISDLGFGSISSYDKVMRYGVKNKLQVNFGSKFRPYIAYVPKRPMSFNIDRSENLYLHYQQFAKIWSAGFDYQFKA